MVSDSILGNVQGYDKITDSRLTLHQRRFESETINPPVQTVSAKKPALVSPLCSVNILISGP
jgi:hypothetical protein